MRQQPHWKDLFWFTILANLLLWACIAAYLHA